MTFNVNSLLCRQYYAYCDETAEVESSGFRCKVLYLSELHINFGEEIQSETVYLCHFTCYESHSTELLAKIKYVAFRR